MNRSKSSPGIQALTGSSVAVAGPQCDESAAQSDPGCVVSRRTFLLTSAAATTAFTVMVSMPGAAGAEEVPAAVALYPRKLIGRLGELKVDSVLGSGTTFSISIPDDLERTLGNTASGA